MKRTLSWLAAGGLVAGALDLCYAIVFSHVNSGVPPIRILQSACMSAFRTDCSVGRVAHAGVNASRSHHS